MKLHLVPVKNQVQGAGRSIPENIGHWIKLVFCIALITAALVELARSAQPYKDHHIEGSVVCGLDRIAVPGAEIVAVATDDETCGGFAYADADGLFRIDHLRPGNFTVRVLASGFPGPVIQKVKISSNTASSDLDIVLNSQHSSGASSESITLEGNRGSVSGTVTKASDGSPMENVRVVLEAKGGEEVVAVQTGSDGRYVLPNVIPDIYTLRVIVPDEDSGFVPSQRDINLNRGQRLIVDFALQEYRIIENPLCVVEGTVVDALTGEPLPAVSIKQQIATRNQKTDANGKFRLSDVPYGPRVLSFSKSGYVTNYQREVLIPGEIKSLSMKLMPVALSRPVGPSGGVIGSSNGSFMTIPSGALDKVTEISLTTLPSEDYFQGYNTHQVVNAFKILPDGLTFLKPASLNLPLKERLPAGTEFSVSMFRSETLEFGTPIIGRVSDNGKFLVISLTSIQSYGIPRRECLWVKIQNSDFAVQARSTGGPMEHYCENHRSWVRTISHSLNFHVQNSVEIPDLGEVPIDLHYVYNWYEDISCKSDWCRRNYIVPVAYGTLVGYVEMCVDPQFPPQTPLKQIFGRSEKRVRITSATYNSGHWQNEVPCADGVICQEDEDLCTKDICQGGECTHPDTDAAIDCRRQCRYCDSGSGGCAESFCKRCEKCEERAAPVYGECVPECISAADCPEPADPCYRAFCRSDHCCDQERLGDPPCDE
jgi:hypothetical protein